MSPAQLRTPSRDRLTSRLKTSRSRVLLEISDRWRNFPLGGVVATALRAVATTPPCGKLRHRSDISSKTRERDVFKRDVSRSREGVRNCAGDIFRGDHFAA